MDGFMTNLRALLAKNIKAYRRELKLSQAKLAEKAGTATHYIAMIEGSKNFPSPEMIERIALALNKDSLDLFAIAPLHREWQDEILSEIERIIKKKRKG
jgi:transcriptional regulator with XRE-family HTH domain